MSNNLSETQLKIYEECINTSNNILYYGPSGSGKTLVLHNVMGELRKTQKILLIENISDNNTVTNLLHMLRSRSTQHNWNDIVTVMYISGKMYRQHLLNLSRALQTITGSNSMFGGKRVIIECPEFDTTDMSPLVPEDSRRQIYVYNITDITRTMTLSIN